MRKSPPAPPALLLAFIAFFATEMSHAAEAAASSDLPNVILIISDDHAWTDFGFMGHPVIETPHLDQFAAESALFTNGYVPTSLCRASLATLLTGHYASEHKIANNDPPEGIAREAMDPFIQNVPTIPRLLQENGYRSLQTGKFWEGHFSRGGFSHGMTEKGRHGDKGLDIGRKTMQPIYDFIKASPDPFFVWYAPMMPHTPHNPPERLLQKYQARDRHEKLARYYAMCEWFDETCGELLTYLDENDLRENTLVLFVVDNGWIQETSDVRTTRGPFAPKSKSSPYDGGLRTPVMLRWPGKIEPAAYPDLVSTIDIAPTILATAQVEPPSALPGRNLLERAIYQNPLQRKAVYGEIFEHDAVDLSEPEASLTHRWIRNGDWKLILPANEAEQSELYNLGADPYEETNLAECQPGRTLNLTSQLVDWAAHKGE